MIAAQKIDRRTRQKIVEQAQALLKAHVPSWRGNQLERRPNDGPVVALVEIFARYMEIAIERLNRVPERNFLAFLDMIGTSLLPPKAARAPVQFLLAAGAKTEGRVPAGTPLATAGTVPHTFETEKDLVVTPAKIESIVVHDPGNDKYDIYQAGDTFPVFSGETLIDHSVSLANDTLLRINKPTIVTVQLELTNLAEDHFRLLNSLQWSVGQTELLPTPTPLPPTHTVEIKLSNIDAIQEQTINSQNVHWLTAKTKEPLAVGQQMPTVTITGLKTERAGSIAPDVILAGNAPVDLTKGGFWPFGEKPKVNDAFYIGSDEVFSRRGAQVTMTFGFTKGAGNNPSLAWEYWNEQQKTWTRIDSVDDKTINFRADPNMPDNRDVCFTIPDNLDKALMGDRRLYAIRVRLASGNYGGEAKLTKTGGGNTLADWTYAEANWNAPSIQSITLNYRYLEFQPLDAVATRNNFSYARYKPTDSFPMFVPPQPEHATVVYIGFDRPFANRMVSLYLPVGEQEDPPKDPVVAWEYWNGTDYVSLGVRDETRNLTQPGMLEFLGPTDFALKEEFGGPARYWLRAKLEQGKNDRDKFKLAGIILNAVWARQGTTITGETLGSSTGKPEQAFTLSRAPILEGEELEVREPECPSQEELEALKREGGFDPVSADSGTMSGASEVWVRWQPVEHFHLSGPASRHYVLDRQSGKLRFGNGVQGKIPPAGRDNIRMRRYRIGGGRAGNVAAGSITVLKRAIPLIAGVTNPAPAAGGTDQERTEEVMVRGPLRLKHRDRAVTSEDYEWLARESLVSVARARCVPAKTDADAGKIKLLIIPDEDVPKPYPSPGLRRHVAEYINDRHPDGVNLSVIGPTYVEACVTASVVPLRFEEADQVRQRILQQLSKFLHPLKGGPDETGWAFGRDVYLSELLAVMEETEGVDYVKTARLVGRVRLAGSFHTGGVSTNILTGVGTHFTELVAGDQLWLNDTERCLILEVISGTSLKIDQGVEIPAAEAKLVWVTNALLLTAPLQVKDDAGELVASGRHHITMVPA